MARNHSGRRQGGSGHTRPSPRQKVLGPAPDITKRFVPMKNGGARSLAGHAGLVFDRYLPLWEENTDEEGQAVGPLAYGKAYPVLQAFVEAEANGASTKKRLLEEYLHRQENLVSRCKGKSHELALVAPLLQGMGLSHPTGNGFLFDPVLGLPWLPGTVIKGLCRRGAALAGVADDEIKQVFGPEPETDDQAVGSLIFLDAWPTQWPALEVQVMTPHYSSYYSALQKKHQQRFWDDPHGLDDPVPIHFLSVRHNTNNKQAPTCYRFCILPRRSSATEIDGMDQTERVFEWLQLALDLLGAGAKTAVGYGYFEESV